MNGRAGTGPAEKGGHMSMVGYTVELGQDHRGTKHREWGPIKAGHEVCRKLGMRRAAEFEGGKEGIRREGRA